MPPKKPAKRRRAARAKSTVPAPNPEVVGSVAGVPLPRDPFAGAQVRLVLEMVVLRRVQRGRVMDNSGEWVNAVLAKLISINVTTLKELVLAAPTLNQTLCAAHCRPLNDVTVSEMMEELVEMVEWGEGTSGVLDSSDSG